MNITSSLITGFIISVSPEQSSVSEMLIKDDTIQKTITNQLSIQNHSFSKNYIQLFEELFSYNELKENWDGYNGIKPDNEVILTVESFLNILQEKKITSPEIMLSGEGEIALFWKNKKDYIEVSFYTKEYLTFFYTLGSSFYGEDDISFDKNIPIKLYSAINFFQNELSSNETKILIKSTEEYSNTISTEVA